MVDIYLRSVPSDADPDDVRLYDPTAADATGGATAPGSTITIAVSLLPGAATGGAVAPGDTLTVTSSLISGVATGGAAAGGATLTTALSLIPGTATGGSVVPVAAIEAGDYPPPRITREDRRRRRRLIEHWKRLDAAVEAAARELYGEDDPPLAATAAVARAREVLAEIPPMPPYDFEGARAALALERMRSAHDRLAASRPRDDQEDEDLAEILLLAA